MSPVVMGSHSRSGSRRWAGPHLMFQQIAVHCERAQKVLKQAVASDFCFLSACGQVEVCVRKREGYTKNDYNSNVNNNLFVCDTLTFLMFYNLTLSPSQPQKARRGSPAISVGFPGGAHGKEPSSQCRRYKRLEFNPWVRKIPWRRKPPVPLTLCFCVHGHSLCNLGEARGLCEHC